MTTTLRAPIASGVPSDVATAPVPLPPDDVVILRATDLACTHAAFLRLVNRAHAHVRSPSASQSRVVVFVTPRSPSPAMSGLHHSLSDFAKHATRLYANRGVSFSAIQSGH